MINKIKFWLSVVCVQVLATLATILVAFNIVHRDLVEVKQGELYEVFNKMIHAVGMENDNIKLFIAIDEDTPNAYANSFGNIVLYKGLITFNAKFPEFTYAVLAHEVAHIYKGHLSPSNFFCHFDNACSRSKEKEADLVGIEIMKKIGLDHCAMGHYRWKMVRTYGPGVPTTHPSHIDRARYTQCESDQWRFPNE